MASALTRLPYGPSGVRAPKRVSAPVYVEQSLDGLPAPRAAGCPPADGELRLGRPARRRALGDTVRGRVRGVRQRAAGSSRDLRRRPPRAPRRGAGFRRRHPCLRGRADDRPPLGGFLVDLTGGFTETFLLAAAAHATGALARSCRVAGWLPAPPVRARSRTPRADGGKAASRASASTPPTGPAPRKCGPPTDG